MAEVRFRQLGKNSLASEGQNNIMTRLQWSSQERESREGRSPEGDRPALSDKEGSGAAVQEFSVIAGLREKE